MRYTGIILLGLLVIGFSSCKNQKDTTKDAVVETTNVEEVPLDYYAEGYQKAYIRHFPENTDECAYLIQLIGEGVLEPLELDESLKVDRKLVWIKFVRQRRLSKCAEATPINIIDIQEREE